MTKKIGEVGEKRRFTRKYLALKLGIIREEEESQTEGGEKENSKLWGGYF